MYYSKSLPYPISKQFSFTSFVDGDADHGVAQMVLCFFGSRCEVLCEVCWMLGLPSLPLRIGLESCGQDVAISGHSGGGGERDVLAEWRGQPGRPPSI